MSTITGRYLGDLKIECTHELSGTKIITDAPPDNNGKGESFSPTDLCAMALGTCALTLMGIYAQQHDIDISGTTMEVTKAMKQDPRRIGKIEVILRMPNKPYTDKQKTGLERAVWNCPVHWSLAENLEQVFSIRWQD